MARHKDKDWHLPDGVPDGAGCTTHSWESINAALLMDIRDELKALNRTLSCYRVREMADASRRIDRRLARRIPLRPLTRRS